MIIILLCCVSVSGGTPSEAGSSYPWPRDNNKVRDWLMRASSSGYGTDAASSQVDVMSTMDEDEMIY